MIATSYNVDADRKFRQALARAKAAVGDLRIPLGLIAADFRRSEKAIFKLRSRGGYPDLAPSTKVSERRHRERKKIGLTGLYPILVMTGRTRDSLINRSDSDAVTIITKSTLTLGTKVPYVRFHQKGTKNMPMRKVLFIGPESRQAESKEILGRPGRWKNILNEFVLEKMGAR